MADDIVTRLRDWHTAWDWYLPDQAADEIERLQAEVEIITKALRLVCDDISDFQANDQMSFDEHITQVMNDYIEEARRGDR